MNQGRLLDKNFYLQFPYSDYRQEMKQTVTLRGKTYQRFILDTGAPLCISRKLQEQHKFPVLFVTEIYDSNNTRDSIVVVTVDTLSIGGVRFINIPAVVIDFSKGPTACENLDGFVGSNVTRFFILQVDTKARQMIFTDQPHKLDIVNQPSYPVRLDDQSNAYLAVRFNDGFTDTTHFDSGMRRFYHMNDKRAQQFVRQYGEENTVVLTGSGTTNQGIFGSGKASTQMVLKARQMQFGNAILKNAHFEITNNPSRIGREWLKYGKLTIDYPNSRYYWQPYTITEAINPREFGIRFQSGDGFLKAGLVWQGSQAEKAGIKAGDEIKSLNGREFSNLNTCAVDNVLREELQKDTIVLELKGFQRQVRLSIMKLK